MMLFGSMVWAWVIGSLCGILATLNPHATDFQNTMDELNHFMRERNFPEPHRMRLREFFRQTQDFSRLASYDKLMVKMSVQLRGDTALRIALAQLSKVWYFSLESVEKEFLAVVALNLQGAVYEAREVLPCSDLTVLEKGMAAKRLFIFTKGAVLGTDCLIPDERKMLRAAREAETANCLTFVQTSHISRSALFTIVEHFPVAKGHLRKASALYTLQAAFRLYHQNWKDERKLLQMQNDRSKSFKQTLNRASTCTRMKCVRLGAGQPSSPQPHRGRVFQDILASVEQAKRDQRKDSASFSRHRRAMEVPRYAANSGGGILGGADADLLQRQLAELRKGQEVAARKAGDLLARSDALELHNAVLDQKLELILELLAKQTSQASPPHAHSIGHPPPARKASVLSPAPGGGQSNASASMIKHEKVTESGQVLHRRRKKPELRNAVCAVQLVRQQEPAATVGGPSVLGIAAAAAAQRVRQQAERQELKDVLNA